MSAGTERLRRVVESAMRLAAGLFLLSALVLGACGDEPASVTTAGPSTTAEVRGGSDDLVDETPLGPGSWSGARTTVDDDVLITFVGGPPYDPDDPCSIAYDVLSEERADEVRVTFSARRPEPPDGPFGCEDLGYSRQVVADLERPLGARRLVEVQFDRVRPVFDGTTLLEPAALPEGWSLLWEGPGYPNPESTTTWSRTWGPPPPEPTDQRCTPAPAPVTLDQGPAAPAERRAPNGEQAVGTYDVGGAEATYAVSATSNSRVLTWVDGGIGFALTSMDRCQGDPPTSPDLLVQIARSLG